MRSETIKKGLLLLFICFSFSSFASKHTKLNRSIIFDFLMNHELSDLRESNFISDFCTKEIKSKQLYRSVLQTKTYKGETDSTLVVFQNIYKKAVIKKIIFSSGDIYADPKHKKYVYTFSYKGNLPTMVYRDGKPRFQLRYGPKKVLSQIYVYNGTNDNTLIHLYYDKTESKIKIGYTSINRSTKKETYRRSKDFIIWNKELKISSFKFHVSYLKNIEYNKQNERSEITVRNSKLTYEYTKFNSKGDWTERKQGLTTWKRKFY